MTRQELAERLDAELCRAYGPDSETVAAWRTVAGIRVVRYQGAPRDRPAPRPERAPIE